METKFKPTQFILVRSKYDNALWHLETFSHEDTYHVYCSGNLEIYKDDYEFIPYEGNEHLCGTTDDYEEPFEPKDGDFIAIECKEKVWICIFQEIIDTSYSVYASLKSNGEYWGIDELSIDRDDKIRPATEEEKQTLLSALHKEGKDWDAEKKEIVDYKWKPKQDEKVLIIEYNEAYGMFFPTEWHCDWKTSKSNAYYHEMMLPISEDTMAVKLAAKLNEAIKNVK